MIELHQSNIAAWETYAVRRAIITLALFATSCATGEVRTPEQAKNIALSSVCLKREPVMAPNERKPTGILAERRGDRWYVWMPFGQGAEYNGITKYGHMGAWIGAKEGKLLYCEGGASRPLGLIVTARCSPAGL
jgi:hypothetical protein